MKRRKRVTKRAKRSRKVTKKVTNIEASATSARWTRRPRYLPDDLAGMYKPVKKPVTLRLDADVLAWFQRIGRGYQTRINWTLRRVMIGERKAERKKARG